jgi:hypothetical protein
MNFFSCTKLGMRTTTRAYSFADLGLPMLPIASVVDDVEEDQIDYSPIIQQEAAGKSSKHV